MADLLSRYGLKEVADVTFYEISPSGEAGAPVLVLDSLKVSSIEQTAEQTDARGGKGNTKLITWDYGKEITLNIEDALFSPKSLAIMFGNSTVDTTKTTILRTKRVLSTSTKISDLSKAIGASNVSISTTATDTPSTTVALVYGDVDITDQSVAQCVTSVETGSFYNIVWKEEVASPKIITITPNSFPGTYYVTGDTVVRNEQTGHDEYFQFIIPKAKMQAEQTLTMEAEGDPSTFNMTMQVLRPANGEMIKFIQYDIA